MFCLVTLMSNVDQADVDSVYPLVAITLKTSTMFLEAVTGARANNRSRSFDSRIPRDVFLRTISAEIESYMHEDVCVSIDYNSK